MGIIQEKANFLKHTYVKKLETINPLIQASWGKMNVHQMVEHMSEMFRVASGKVESQLETTEEHLPRMQAFLHSDKPFRENTPNKLLPDTPPLPRHATVKDSLNELQGEIDHFFAVYEKDPAQQITNPFFGDLDYEMQIKLLYKHALHHLRQFGVIV